MAMMNLGLVYFCCCQVFGFKHVLFRLCTNVTELWFAAGSAVFYNGVVKSFNLLAYDGKS